MSPTPDELTGEITKAHAVVIAGDAQAMPVR
jgi:hypothetical protein